MLLIVLTTATTTTTTTAAAAASTTTTTKGRPFFQDNPGDPVPEQIVQYKTDTVPPPWFIFSSPGGTPGAIATKIRDAVSGSDLCPCAKLQPNPFSSLGGDASRTDRLQT